MQVSFCFVLLLIVTAVSAAGCTQGTGPVPMAAPVPVATPDLHGLALNPSEVPACFILTEQYAKRPADVGQLAKDLGWKAGYGVTYTCIAEGRDPTVIMHSLAVYPAVNMPGILSMVDQQDRSAGFTYEDLSFPDKGFVMRGFYGKTGGAQVSGVSPGTNVLTGRSEVPDMNAVSGSDVAEIIIYRGTIFEVLRMTGPKTNVTLLRDIALKASAKIP